MSKIANLPTLAELVDKTREIGQARPNVIYQRRHVFTDGFKGGPACVYVERMPGGEYIPSCIIGHAFVELGVNPADLEFPDHEGIDILTILYNWEYDVLSSYAEWLGCVQSAQDHGIAWGNAVEGADRTVVLL